MHIIQRLLLLTTLLAAAKAARDSWDSGPLPTNHSAFKVSSMDSTDQWIDVYYPTPPNAIARTFPLLSYAHGDAGGGIDSIAYKPILETMASYGFILIFTRACNVGCADKCSSLPDDPPCFGHFYDEQLKQIEWAKNSSADATAPAYSILNKINHDLGYGIIGHSMGGQATLFSSSYDNATANNIKAAVMQHAYTHQFPSPTVPFLAFTGSWDTIAPPAMTHNFFDAAAASGTAPNRAFVNKKDATHLEPIWWPSVSDVGKFSAAWFKLHLELVDQQDGIDYASLIYGNGTESLCGGGDGVMVECVVTPRRR